MASENAEDIIIITGVTQLIVRAVGTRRGIARGQLVQSRILSARRASPATVAVHPLWRYLRWLGVAVRLQVDGQSLFVDGDAIDDDVSIEPRWFGVQLTAATRSWWYPGSIDDIEGLKTAIKDINAAHHTRQRNAGIRRATIHARRLQEIIPYGTYVTWCHRQSWIRERDRCRRDMADADKWAPLPKRLLRLRAWCGDFPAVADREREAAAQAEILHHKSLLDTVEKDPLTNAQRRAVVAQEARVATNAGAGCGKTGTLVARSAYRVASGARKPHEILALTFTVEAAREMHKRINALAMRGVTARNYHSLALRIARQTTPRRRGGRAPRVMKGDQRFSRLVRAILDRLIREGRLQVAELLAFHTFPEFVRREDLTGPNAYMTYLRAFRPTSIDGKACRSGLEAAVANLFILNKTPYERWPKDQTNQRPTFRLVGDRHVCIVADAKGAEAHIIRSFQPRSTRRDAITLRTSEHELGRALSGLATRLKIPEVMSDSARHALYNHPKYGEYLDHLVREMTDFHRSFRASCLQLSDIGLSSHRAQLFLQVYEEVAHQYAAILERHHRWDFDQILEIATTALNVGWYRANWRDLIIDEYQDVTEREIRFFEALQRSGKMDVFVVGDDWQSIYGFKGARWNALQTFGSRFGGKGDFEEHVYPETHRSVDRIHEPAGTFVRKNRSQTQKHLTSTRPAANSVRIIVRGVDEAQLKPLSTASLVDQILSELAREHDTKGKGSALVLHRKRRHEHPAIPSTIRNLSVRQLTIHKAKGLGVDYVIGSDLFRSFPGHGLVDPLQTTFHDETYLHAEERRVLYVAVTRARERVYLLTEWFNMSVFLAELADEGYDVCFEGAPWDRPDAVDRELLRCTECAHGTLKPTENGYFGCSNFPYCERFHDMCPAPCGGFINTNRYGAACLRCGKQWWACDLCSSGIIEIVEGRSFARCSRFSATSASCQRRYRLDQLSVDQKKRAKSVERWKKP